MFNHKIFLENAPAIPVYAGLSIKNTSFFFPKTPDLSGIFGICPAEHSLSNHPDTKFLLINRINSLFYVNIRRPKDETYGILMKSRVVEINSS